MIVNINGLNFIQTLTSHLRFSCRERRIEKGATLAAPLITLNGLLLRYRRRIHSQLLHQECPLVRHFFYLLRNRLSATVACTSLHPHQYRSGPCLVGLHGSREFERMSRNYSIIVIRSHHEARRILRPGFQLVQRRILVDRPELLSIVRRSVIRSPSPPDRELVETQHVHHAHARQRCPEQVGPLCQACAYQQSAVAPTSDRQLR